MRSAPDEAEASAPLPACVATASPRGGRLRSDLAMPALGVPPRRPQHPRGPLSRRDLVAAGALVADQAVAAEAREKERMVARRQARTYRLLPAPPPAGASARHPAGSGLTGCGGGRDGLLSGGGRSDRDAREPAWQTTTKVKPAAVTLR